MQEEKRLDKMRGKKRKSLEDTEQDKMRKKWEEIGEEELVLEEIWGPTELLFMYCRHISDAE